MARAAALFATVAARCAVAAPFNLRAATGAAAGGARDIGHDALARLLVDLPASWTASSTVPSPVLWSALPQPPVAGADFIIPPEQYVMLDVSPPPLGTLTIYGRLDFVDSAAVGALTLTAANVIVWGVLNVGNVTVPRVQPATIVLSAVGASVLAPPTAFSAASTNQAPVFFSPGGTYVVADGAAVGTYVGDVAATDADGPSPLRFTLQSGTGFGVHPVTGAILVTASPSRATAIVSTLTVSVTDGLNTVMTSFTVLVMPAASLTAAGVVRQHYSSCGGGDVGSVTQCATFPASPNTVTVLSNMDYFVANDETNYGDRYRAFLVPNVTFSTQFYLSCDDTCEMRLSNSTSFVALPAAPTVAVKSWEYQYTWSPYPPSQPVMLVKGQWYAMEVIFAQGGGAASVALAWAPPGTAPADGSNAAVVPAALFRQPSAITPVSPPTAVSVLLPESVTSNAVTLTWTVASDATGVAFYNLMRNGILVTTVPHPSANSSNANVVRAVVTETTAGVTPTYGVQAVNVYGIVGPITTLSNVTTGITFDAVRNAYATGDPRGVLDYRAVIPRIQADIFTTAVTQNAFIDAIYPPNAPVSVIWPVWTTPALLVAPAPSALSRVFPFLRANWCNQGWGALTPCTAPITFGSAGLTPNGTRFVAMDDTPFKPGFNATATRLLSWLITGSPTSLPSAAAASSLYVGLGTGGGDTSFATWLLGAGFIASTSQTVTCSYTSRIDLCLDANGTGSTSSLYTRAGRTPLLIIGTYNGNQNGDDPVYGANMLALLARADRERIPVLFIVQTAWSATAVDRNVGAAMGFRVDDMDFWYGGVAQWQLGDYAALRANLQQSSATNLNRTLAHMMARDWAVDLTSCITPNNCNPAATAYFNPEFLAAARDMKSQLDMLHSGTVDLFATPSSAYLLIKGAVILGDVIRRFQRFPLLPKSTDKTALQDFFAGYYADHVVYNVRPVNPPYDLGTFAAPLPAGIPMFNDSFTLVTRLADYSTSVGCYAVPGVPFTVLRTDNGTNTLQVFINILRSGSTQEMLSYARPKFLTSASMTLTPGVPLRITSPYGGPLFLFIQSTNPLANVSVNISNVGHHPFWRSPADTPAFVAGINAGVYSWAELLTPGFQVHSRLSYMSTTMQSPFWSTPDLVAHFTYTNFYQVNYNLAGFTGTGLSLSPQALTFCAARNWTAANGLPCTDINIHGLKGMQHFNSDQANCGYGCSGNPYDAWWAFSITGWGDSHEMGHNLQSFGIYGVTGEASNNIFPLNVKTHWNDDHPSMLAPSEHNEDHNSFYRWIMYCQVNQTQNPGGCMRSSVWAGAAAAAAGAGDAGVTQSSTGTGNNDFMINFYEQIVGIADSIRNPDGSPTMGNHGWDVWTLMYTWQRLLGNARSNADQWATQRAFLGMSNYSFTDTWTGEEQLLLGTSWILQRDLRPQYDMWGIVYSAQAALQIVLNGFPTPGPARYYYKPVSADGVFWSPTAFVGNVVMNASNVLPQLPVVPYGYLFIGPYGVETPPTFPARTLVGVTAVIGASSGTVSFTANGLAIANCTNVPLIAVVLTSDIGGTASYTAYCAWSPQLPGAYFVAASVNVSLAVYARAPLLTPINTTITDSPTAPLILGMSTSAALPGTQVQLTGAYLNWTGSVYFNAQPVTFVIDDATQLTVTVPAVSPALTTGIWLLSTATGFMLRRLRSLCCKPSQALSSRRRSCSSIAVQPRSSPVQCSLPLHPIRQSCGRPQIRPLPWSMRRATCRPAPPLVAQTSRSLRLTADSSACAPSPSCLRQSCAPCAS